MKNEIFEVTLVCDITTAQETLRISYANTQKTSSVRMLLTLYLIGLDIDSEILPFYGLASILNYRLR